MKILNKNIGTILLFFFLGLIISDFATSIAYKFLRYDFYRYSGAFKLAFEFFMLVVIALNLKKTNTVFRVFLLYVTLFIISQLLIYDETYNLKMQFLKGNIYFFNRYTYILIFIVFLNLFSLRKNVFNKIYNNLELLLTLNCIFILIGFIFEFEILKSYEYTNRFGYIGLFSKPEEASFLYGILIIKNFYSWVNIQQNQDLFKCLFFIAISFLFGQKKMFLFLWLLLLVYLLFLSRHKIKCRVAVVMLTVLAIIFKNEIFQIIINHSSFWMKIYQENGFWSTVTSIRSALLEHAVNYIQEHWSLLNYIFGGINFGIYKTELELIDLYLFTGLSGILFYFYIIKEHILKNADSLKIKLILTLFITSFVSGGLLLSVTSVLFLYVVANYIMISEKRK